MVEWWIIYASRYCQEIYFYVKGCKIINGLHKPINAYIVSYDEHLVGYFQFYNAYDFARTENLEHLPESLGAFDIFIGEEAFLGKGIGSLILRQFLLIQIMKIFPLLMHMKKLALKK